MADFTDDLEKMVDFYEMSKEDFLKSYSYLTEEEYNDTKLKVIDEEKMSKKVFEKIVELDGFNKAIQCYNNWHNPYCLCTYETLKKYAVYLIKLNDMKLGLHLLNAIYYSGESDWYYYDYTAGLIETPQEIKNIEDVEYYLGFEE